MKELFQIRDYIRIGSSNYVNEFKDKLIHFEHPSKDFRFWFKNSRSHDGELFRRLISGEILQIDSNHLAVELPKTLVGNQEENQQMVDSIFGTQGLENGVLSMSQQILQRYSYRVEILFDTIRWESSGLRVEISFSTRVWFEGAVPRPTRSELRDGVECVGGENETISRALHEIIMNPDGVELIHTESGNYIIEKSNDRSVQKRKFCLMHEGQFGALEYYMRNLVKVFSFQEFSDPVQRIINGARYRFEQGQFRMPFQSGRSFYSFQQTNYIDRAQDFIEYYASLRNAFSKGLERLKNSTNGLGEHEKLEFPFSRGILSMNVRLMKLRATTDIAKWEKDFLDELQLRIDVLDVILKFLTDEVGMDKRPDENAAEVFMDYAYDRISSDPMAFVDPSAGEFQKFAKGLLGLA